MAAEVLGESSVFTGQGMQLDLTPKDWGPEERQYYMERFNELGNLWQNQTFDLYHRPFMLPNVVPDPYAHQRVPKRLTKKQRDQRPSLPEFLPRATCCKPPEYATSGLEKYAFGRSFFISAKGYMGLAPSDAKSGDDIAVLFSGKVPFILRKGGDASSHYLLIGETYVHGIMDDEVMIFLGEGNVKAEIITLC
jgi:hypothetical protein